MSVHAVAPHVVMPRCRPLIEPCWSLALQGLSGWQEWAVMGRQASKQER
jgi:hypothetical protein